MIKLIAIFVVHANIALNQSINMPAMPRPSGKASRIAYAVLGKPANMQHKRGRRSSIQQKLIAQDTRLVKGVSNGS